MKKILILTLVLLVTSGMFIWAGGQQDTGKDPNDALKDQWLRENQLGPYYSETQDWAAIEAAAKEEGSVIIYANSSKIAKAADIWNELYPDIKIEGYDLGGDDVLAKTLGEQQARLFVGDVWFSSGGADVIGNVLPHEYIWRFVPKELEDTIDPAFTNPLLVSRLGTTLLCYNTELNDRSPITNIWQITEPEWYRKVVVEDPLNDASTMSKLLKIGRAHV